MKGKFISALLLAAGLLAAGRLSTPASAAEPKETKATGEHLDAPGVGLETAKIEESDAKGQLEEPHFGYVGLLGTFEAAVKGPTGEEPVAMFVVHAYPHEDQITLGQTKLKYVGPKRLGNVDGWVFDTTWNGKSNPSKVFFSAEKVYFGGGVREYIAADYREGTGWTWKCLPLRRMELTKAVAENTTEGK